MSPGEPWHRLAAAVRTRRIGLGLSVCAAARSAGINRLTWTSEETARHQLSEYLWAPVEQVLDCWPAR